MKALERLQRYGSKAYAKMQGKEWTKELHQKLKAKYGDIPKERPIREPKEKTVKDDITKEKTVKQKEIKQRTQERDEYLKNLSIRTTDTNKEILQKLRKAGFSIDNNKAGVKIRNARLSPFIKHFDRARKLGIMRESSIDRMLKEIKNNIKRGNHRANEDLYIKLFDRPDGTHFRPS